MQFEHFFQRVSQATRITAQKDLAKMLGVNSSAVTHAKTRGVPEHWVHIVASLYGLNAAWLRTGTGPMHQDNENRTLFIPKVSAKACGGGGSLEVSDNVVAHLPFDRDWISRKGQTSQMVAMDIVGESMSPELEPGDTILIDQSRNRPTDTAPYVVSLNGELLVKRLQARPGLVILLSANPKYAPVTLQGDEIETLRIIGRVLWSSRTYGQQ